MKPTEYIKNDLTDLADHARALIAATADNAEEHVKDARSRLIAALDVGKSITSRFYDQASARTRACDLAVHENPYIAVGLAIGIGAFMGYYIVRGCRTCRRGSE
jgi:ElaB/YqjD/DUF883 family membrane-anchored ribosome-binding protein